MTLEAVVFPQNLFGCTYKELHAMEGVGGGEAWSYAFDGIVEQDDEDVVLQYNGVSCESQDQGRGLLGVVHGNWDSSRSSMLQKFEWDVNSLSPEKMAVEAAAERRKKRRRLRSAKNKEELENQRMTHIAVERNRRKLMNEYLTVLQSLMPPSYVQRGDQASIIGGAINFVKELEQLLQSLEAQKQIKQSSDNTACVSFPFTEFFTFPQYSSCATGATTIAAAAATTTSPTNSNTTTTTIGANSSGTLADIEVSMVESHASLKILSRRQPKQLIKMVIGLQNLRLTTLHLNMTTMDQMVLYSFSLKLEKDCQFTSVDEIATAVYQMLGRIQEEAGFN